MRNRCYEFYIFYILLRMSIAIQKNLMFNVIFYIVILNYYFKIFQEGVAAKIKLDV